MVNFSLIQDVPEDSKETILIKKLQQCCIIFDFNDPSLDIQQKDIKTETLNEIVEYISTHRNTINEQVCCEIINTVAGNENSQF